MNKIFRKQIGKFVLIYLDEILVYSRSPTEHLKHLKEVFEILKQQRFHCKLHKYYFNNTRMKYLGHIISADGFSSDPEKVQKVKDWPQPTNVGDVHSFLGLANYFRKFMQDYNKMVLPLTDLTCSSSGKRWKWMEQCIAAFEKVKHCLTHAPLLRMPDFDKPFEVVADASEIASGAVLLQEGQPTAFDSKNFNVTEQNYMTTKQEMLASMRAMQTWRCYLEFLYFTLVKNHCPHTSLKSQPTLNKQQAR